MLIDFVHYSWLHNVWSAQLMSCRACLVASAWFYLVFQGNLFLVLGAFLPICMKIFLEKWAPWLNSFLAFFVITRSDLSLSCFLFIFGSTMARVRLGCLLCSIFLYRDLHVNVSGSRMLPLWKPDASADGVLIWVGQWLQRAWTLKWICHVAWFRDDSTLFPEAST